MPRASDPSLKTAVAGLLRMNAARIIVGGSLVGGLAAAAVAQFGVAAQATASKPAAAAEASVAAQPSAAAQPTQDRWRLVGQSPSMRLYYEPATIVREGDIRRVRELQDLDLADPDGVRSRVYLNEYDCRNQMHRLGQMQSFSSPMLGGERRFEVKDMGYWRKIPGGSAFAQVYKQVCPDGQALPVAEPATPLQRLFSKD